VPPHLPGFLHALAPTLNHYGYLAVGGLVLLEDFGVPVPGETILILAAVYAASGRLNVIAVALIAFAAAVIGDNIGFAIGHFGGQPLVERFGRYVLLTPKRLERGQAFFERHGGKVITFARFVEGLRQANGIVAGIAGIHWKRFLVFNALGAALWVGVWTAVGTLAGNHIEAIYNALNRYVLYVVGALAAALVVYVALRLWRRRRAAG
jgi:membrane protein DedA with SNARE-associated domain